MMASVPASGLAAVRTRTKKFDGDGPDPAMFAADDEALKSKKAKAKQRRSFDLLTTLTKDEVSHDVRSTSAAPRRSSMSMTSSSGGPTPTRPTKAKAQAQAQATEAWPAQPSAANGQGRSDGGRKATRSRPRCIPPLDLSTHSCYSTGVAAGFHDAQEQEQEPRSAPQPDRRHTVSLAELKGMEDELRAHHQQQQQQQQQASRSSKRHSNSHSQPKHRHHRQQQQQHPSQSRNQPRPEHRRWSHYDGAAEPGQFNQSDTLLLARDQADISDSLHCSESHLYRSEQQQQQPRPGRRPSYKPKSSSSARGQSTRAGGDAGAGGEDQNQHRRMSRRSSSDGYSGNGSNYGNGNGNGNPNVGDPMLSRRSSGGSSSDYGNTNGNGTGNGNENENAGDFRASHSSHEYAETSSLSSRQKKRQNSTSRPKDRKGKRKGSKSRPRRKSSQEEGPAEYQTSPTHSFHDPGQPQPSAARTSKHLEKKGAKETGDQVQVRRRSSRSIDDDDDVHKSSFSSAASSRRVSLHERDDSPVPNVDAGPSHIDDLMSRYRKVRGNNGGNSGNRQAPAADLWPAVHSSRKEEQRQKSPHPTMGFDRDDQQPQQQQYQQQQQQQQQKQARKKSYQDPPEEGAGGERGASGSTFDKVPYPEPSVPASSTAPPKTAPAPTSLDSLHMGSLNNNQNGPFAGAKPSSDLSVETIHTLDSLDAQKLQTSEQLRELIEMMQDEFQKLRDARSDAEMRAQKLETDLHLSREERDAEYVELTEEKEKWKRTAHEERVKCESAVAKAEGLEREREASEAEWERRMEERILAGERVEVRCERLEEENRMLKKMLKRIQRDKRGGSRGGDAAEARAGGSAIEANELDLSVASSPYDTCGPGGRHRTPDPTDLISPLEPILNTSIDTDSPGSSSQRVQRRERQQSTQRARRQQNGDRAPSPIDAVQAPGSWHGGRKTKKGILKVPMPIQTSETDLDDCGGGDLLAYLVSGGSDAATQQQQTRPPSRGSKLRRQSTSSTVRSSDAAPAEQAVTVREVQEEYDDTLD